MLDQRLQFMDSRFHGNDDRGLDKSSPYEDMSRIGTTTAGFPITDFGNDAQKRLLDPRFREDDRENVLDQ